MSRVPWLGRGRPPAGRHAAGPRGRAGTGAGQQAPQADATPATGLPPRAPGPAAGPEPVRPQTGPAAAAAPWSPGSVGFLGAPVMANLPQEPLVSPVTDAARAAAAASAEWLPAYVPPGAAPAVTIDALGRKCPIPIIMLAKQIGDVPVGAVIAVLADDPAAYSDIPAWCVLKSHDCVFRADHAAGWSFGIRRRY
jgi:tRNA 2-thiouridine synthesizing protein A